MDFWLGFICASALWFMFVLMLSLKHDRDVKRVENYACTSINRLGRIFSSSTED